MQTPNVGGGRPRGQQIRELDGELPFRVAASNHYESSAGHHVESLNAVAKRSKNDYRTTNCVPAHLNGAVNHAVIDIYAQRFGVALSLARSETDRRRLSSALVVPASDDVSREASFSSPDQDCCWSGFIQPGGRG
jgi:hypothetical protein